MQHGAGRKVAADEHVEQPVVGHLAEALLAPGIERRRVRRGVEGFHRVLPEQPARLLPVFFFSGAGLAPAYMAGVRIGAFGAGS